MKKVCIIGLGYIGLPTASMFARRGYRVVGVDINAQIIEGLNRGELHVEEDGLIDAVREAMASGNLTVGNTPEPAEAFIIAVPTPINADKTADMRAVISAAESIVPHLRKGNLVILESTSPAGTTVNLIQPILERSGLEGGDGFLLAYSPERVLPGRIMQELVHNARVIGGINGTSADAVRDLYSTIVQGEIVLTDATTAEMVKLMENTFRDANIALANEFALLAEKLGVDVWEAIDIANRHPRVNILRPSPGVGGHCIAVDPWFLVETAPERARLIRQARLVNDGMPGYVVELVGRAVKGIVDPVIACLGLTYKANVNDTRESPAAEIVRQIARSGYVVRAFDPHVPALDELDAHIVNSLADSLEGADLLALLVDHSEFSALTPQAASTMRHRRVLDTRACLEAAVWRQAGFEILRLGASEIQQV